MDFPERLHRNRDFLYLCRVAQDQNLFVIRLDEPETNGALATSRAKISPGRMPCYFNSVIFCVPTSWPSDSRR